MGKQMLNANRHIYKKPVTYRASQIINIKREFSIHWSQSESISFIKMMENGRVLITIVSGYSEHRIMCSGFSLVGNKYHRLIKMLRKKGYINKEKKVDKILVDKGFMNIRVDQRKDQFLSGDKIVIMVSNKGPSCIRKIRKNNKDTAQENKDNKIK